MQIRVARNPASGQGRSTLIVSVKPLLFIDANQYLDLYLLDSAKRLLPALEEQRDYIFVTTQIVDEVLRNKVNIAAHFLTETLKKLAMGGVSVPDHLLGTGSAENGSIGAQLRDIREKAQSAKEAFKNFTPDVLEQISQSKDQVSKTLAGIFCEAVEPDEAELERARARKERGNPPGKNTDPLGDHLTWEQILSQCQDRPRLWIITKDSDYATKYDGKMFLNAFLYRELTRLYQAAPDVFLFDNIAEGLEHFTATMKVKADKLPTPEEAEQIKKEQESLPRLDYDDGPIYLRIQDAFRLSDAMQLRAALASQRNAEEVSIPPFPPIAADT
jgi:hypothetical protein